MKNKFSDYMTVIVVLLLIILFWKFAVFAIGSFVLLMAILVLISELFN